MKILFVLSVLITGGSVQCKISRKIKLLDVTRYLNLDEYYNFLKNLDRVAGDNFDVQVLGNTSLEGKDYANDIYLVKIGDQSKPVIFFDCGIHAREWISPAVCFFLIERLAEFFRHTKKGHSKSSIARFQWQFIPMMNPDGYVLSQTKDRFQRKNDRPFNPNHFTDKEIIICRCFKKPQDCRGVDLNRNFPAGWGMGGDRFEKESNLPCLEVYKGSKPLSEPETMLLDKHMRSLGNRVIGAFSFHSYGKEIYHPKGWLRENDTDQIQGRALKHIENFAKKINKNLNFGIGSVSSLLGNSFLEGGASDDYYYTTLNINISYTIELDPHVDNEDVGFVLPPNRILPVGTKMWRTLLKIAKSFSKLYPNID